MNESVDRTICDEVVARLWPYLDGALPDAERARVATHLAGCSACTSHFDFAQAFLEAVQKTAGSAEDHPALRTRVLDALTKDGFRRT